MEAATPTLEPPVASRPPLVQPRAPGQAWSRLDKIGLAFCWASGVGLCVIAGAIVIYMMVRGIQYLDLSMLVDRPLADLDQSKTGGFFDPLVGTLLLTVLGTAIAAPVGVAIAVWLVEFGRPAGPHARSSPGSRSWPERRASCSRSSDCWSSRPAPPVPLLHGRGRRRVRAVVLHRRDHDGADRAAARRRRDARGAAGDPGARPRGLVRAGERKVGDRPARAGPRRARRNRHRHEPRHGRIAGDTAIVVVLLGASLQLQAEGDLPLLKTLQGTGSTLTSYVYNNSPAGEGNAPEKAYAAAFVLLLIVVFLNFAVTRIATRKERAWRS